MRRVGLALAALLALAACATGVATVPAARHVLMISIDGLRPEFYLDPGYAATELRALMAAGSAARAAETVFPSVTYPSHAAVATGVRPARHGVLFNVRFEPSGARGRWYEEAADLRAPALWDWARAAGKTTAAVSWPSTVGARIDWLLAESNYYARADALTAVEALSTPGLFDRTGIRPEAGTFKDPVQWDTFLAATAAAIVRQARPALLMVHLVQADFFQHKGGRETPEVRAAVARLDAHVGALRRAVEAAGLAAETTIVVTGDHGFQDVDHYVSPNDVLVRAGLRACPVTRGWRATAHVSGGAAAVFVDPAGDAAIAARAEEALRREAGERYTVLTRADLDRLGAMPGVAFALEAAPGFAFAGSCGRGSVEAAVGGRHGTHGFLPSRPSMATGFVAAGAGVRAGVVVDRIRLVDVAPTVAHLLGVPAPPVEGRVLEEILR